MPRSRGRFLSLIAMTSPSRSIEAGMPRSAATDPKRNGGTAWVNMRCQYNTGEKACHANDGHDRPVLPSARLLLSGATRLGRQEEVFSHETVAYASRKVNEAWRDEPIRLASPV